MNRKGRIRYLWVVLALILCLTGCHGEKQADIPSLEKDQEQTTAAQTTEEETDGKGTLEMGEFPRIDGSTATLPLSYRLYQAYTGATEEEAQAAITHSKTDISYYNLIDGYKDVLISYEPSQEVLEATKEKGVPLTMKPIGRDALVFLANMGNPVSSVTGEEVIDIYTGETKNWSALGGENQEIVAFQRPQGSGSQTLVEKLVMKGVPMEEAPSERVLGEMGELLEGVAAYDNSRNAFGYSVYFYAKNMYEKPELKFMAIDQVLPDADTIRTGSYPYVNEFYVVIREDEPLDSDARKLFDWLTTENGQTFVEQAGYVGMIKTDAVPDSANGIRPRLPEVISLPVTEDQRIAFFNCFNGKTMFLDRSGNMEILDSSLQAQERGVSLISLEEPLILMDAQTNNVGLYSLKDHRWVLEPIFWYMFRDKNGFYAGSRKNEFYAWYNRKLEKIYEGEGGRVGDRIWDTTDRNLYAILDENGNQVNTLDVSDINDNDTTPSFYDQYALLQRKGGFTLYDEDGNQVFQSEEMGTGFVAFDGPENEEDTVLRIGDGEKEKLLDFTKKEFITQEAKNFAGNGWYGTYHQEGDSLTLRMEQKEEGKVYDLSLDPIKYKVDQCTINHIPGDYFLILGGDGGSLVFEKEKLLYEADSCYLYQSGDFFVLRPYENLIPKVGYPLVIHKDGQLLYQGIPGEDIRLGEKEFIVTQRGSYTCIVDTDGKLLYEFAAPEMEED